MTKEQFMYFDSFRKEFKQKISEWSAYKDRLVSLQTEAAAGKDGKTDYEVQNPLVYNTALDEVTEKDDIRMILIGDNPGKNEQLEINRRYLVGLAGKLGVKFFFENPELKTDFRKNVIILNKTPVHSARTEQLKYIIKNGGPEIASLISESQKWMAEKTAELHMALSEKEESEDSVPQLWLVGYAELKGKGVFIEYRDTLLETYKKAGKLDFCTDNVFIYQHFSMNRFTIDLKDYINSLKEKGMSEKEIPSLSENLKALGSLHRKEIFGV